MKLLVADTTPVAEALPALLPTRQSFIVTYLYGLEDAIKQAELSPGPEPFSEWAPAGTRI